MKMPEKIMFVQFCAAVASTFDTYPRAKNAKVSKVRLVSKPFLVRGRSKGAVYTTVVDVGGMS